MLGTLRCETKFTFHVQRDADMPAPLKYDVDVQLVRGRIDDPRIPFPLNDLRAHVRATHEGLLIDDFSACNGQTTLQLACQRFGTAANSPLKITIDGHHLPLDQQLLKVLPEPLRAEWYRFLPEGEIDAQLGLNFDGQTWQPQIEVRCLNVAFTYHKFPYRLEPRQRHDFAARQGLQVNLTAYSGGQPIRFSGDLLNPGNDCTGAVEFDGDNLPFDEKLFAAMPDKSRAVVPRACSRRGRSTLLGRVSREDARQPARTSIMQLRLNRCSMNYEKFPTR